MASQNNQDLWIDHSSTCEHCGMGRPVAILEVVIPVGKRTLTKEIAVCAKCRGRQQFAATRVIAERA